MSAKSARVPRVLDRAHTDYKALTVNVYSSMKQMGKINYGEEYEEYISWKSDDMISTANHVNVTW